MATKLKADSGTSLLYAAVASLAVIKKAEMFSRGDLNSEMKAATGFYKPSYTNNLSNYIEALLKQGVLIEASKDSYTLREAERPRMEQRLAD